LDESNAYIAFSEVILHRIEAKITGYYLYNTTKRELSLAPYNCVKSS